MITLTKLILTLATGVAIFLVGKASIASLVKKIGHERAVPDSRVHYTSTVLVLIWALLVVTVSGFVIGIGYQDVGLFFGSMFAVIGVALFAQWSILSNITASVIVFFFFPYRVGHTVRIIDDKNSVEGVIKEITLFHVILVAPDDSITTYPNAMVFQKAVSINPKDSLADKTDEPDTTDDR